MAGASAVVWGGLVWCGARLCGAVRGAVQCDLMWWDLLCCTPRDRRRATPHRVTPHHTTPHHTTRHHTTPHHTTPHHTTPHRITSRHTTPHHIDQVERDYTKMMDLDGDGVITANDVNLWHHKVQDILKFDLPAGLGFTSGWILGIGGPGKLAAGTGVAGAVYGMGARVLLPRVAATTAATTGGPAVVVTASEWWEKAKTTLGVPLAPEEQFRKTLMDYDYGQLKKLQQQLQRQEKAKEMLTFDAEMLAMKQRVVEQRLEVVPPPPAPWWKLW